MAVTVEHLQLQLDGLNSGFLLCKEQEKQSNKRQKQGKQHPQGRVSKRDLVPPERQD